MDLEVAVEHEHNFDAMIFKGGRPGPKFLMDLVVPGRTVYVLAFVRGVDETCRSKGTITSRTAHGLCVDAHADHGWSGGVVVSARGNLVGMIVGETAQKNQVEAVSAEALRFFAMWHDVPTLQA